MISPHEYASVIDGLSACLSQWREERVAAVETSVDTIRLLAVRPTTAAPRPANAAPAARPDSPMPRPTSAAVSVAPPPRASAPAPRPAPAPAAPAFACMAERLVELHDPTPAPQTRLRVVAEASNFQGAAGEFLAKMLRAIGYVLIGSPELSDPRAPGAAVLLVLGPAALAAVKPESMFNMVRGKWVKVGDLQAMVTYDPVYLEVSVAYKRMAWEDLQKIPEKFALSIPALPKR